VEKIEMAKKCWLEKEKKRRSMVEKYAKRRADLIAKKDYEGLQRLPKNASPVRLKNRCQVTGRSHGFLRRFRMSRISFRDLAVRGEIPGVFKASW